MNSNALMNNRAILRLAAPHDADSIAQLHAHSWRIAYRGVLSDDYLDNHVVAERTQAWRERLTSPSANQIVMVAERSDDICGFICAYGDEHVQWGTYVDNLHVRGDMKRQGIGRTLLLAIARWSHERYPGKGISLNVLEANDSARRFYETLGGAPVESGVWRPPGGGEVNELRYAWQDVAALLASAAAIRN